MAKDPARQAASRQATSASEEKERGFDVRGIVRGIDPDKLSITVEHEDIPGFMPSMTMPFTVKDAQELRGISVGNAVAFRFVVTDTAAWITGLRTIKPTAVSLPGEKPQSKSRAARLKEGDKLPAFSLVDQDNRPLTRETLEGKATLLTFIFTRCPVPTFCPLMSNHFSELQKKLAGNEAVAAKVRLLSISFDPLDSPAILATYAKHLEADPALWWHAGGSQKETERLTQAFSVYVREEGSSFSHGLCTALVSPEGTILQLWRGNDWSVDEVWKALAAIPQ